MRLTWYGQASFCVESAAGIRVVTDPYDPQKAGFKPFPDPADVVVKSSSSDDFHDNDHLVPKRPGAVVVDALELAQNGRAKAIHGLEIRAIEAMEHRNHPSGHPDQNAMYRFGVDGMEIGHMGDMGDDFSPAQMDFFRGVDILLSHAGGFPVISLEELMRIVGEVRPRLVVPMHFRTLCFKPQSMHFITEFLRVFPSDAVDFACTSSVEITKDALPSSPRALVMDYL